MSETVGFIGAGQMARALAAGMVASGKLTGQQICFFEPVLAAAEQFLAELPDAKAVTSNRELVANATQIWLAVKPQMLPQVAHEIGGAIPSDALVISIVAGISIEQLAKQLQTGRVVRVMPNTPALIGHGAAGLARSDAVSNDEVARILERMRSVGLCFELDEPLLDVVTGLSGSGPAYIFVVIEALTEGAVRQGMPRAIARQLAAQTVAGAAQMAAQSGVHPAELRDRVTSPGGTTAAGLFALESMQIRAALMSAVEAATVKSKELGQASAKS